jgi:hypothetical protein
LSIKVKEWLKRLGIEVSHEERVQIDREIEYLTGLACDVGIGQLSERQFLDIVDKVRRRKKKGNERSQVLAEALA